ncbi:glycosyltransferase [Lacinutrix undariae]
MKKMKVTHVVGAMNRGGAEVMLMDIFRNMSNDFQLHFLVNYKVKSGIVAGDFDAEIVKKGGKINHIPAQWDIGPIAYLKAFKTFCNEEGLPDVVHIHMNAKSGIIAMAAKKAGVKTVIVHSHANLKFRGNIISRTAATTELFFQKRLMAKYADCFWGCSEEANQSLFLKHLLTKDKSEIINNAIAVEVFQSVNIEKINQLKSKFKLTDNTIVLGNIGRVVRHKNVGFIIEILNELHKKGIDFSFVFAGRDEQPDYLKEILHKAETYNILDRIHYLNVREDIAELMNAFDAFISPALKEGFGLVAVEAQAAGTPCLLYEGFPKTVDMDLGLVSFFSSFKVNEWVDEIVNLSPRLNDKTAIHHKISEKGFDIQSNIAKIEELYLKHINKIK